MPLDLMTEPLIETDAGWFSLPGLMAAMARGEVQSWPAMRPFQRPAWHMFLVQLAVMALGTAGRSDLPDTEADWRALLSALTRQDAGPELWHLIGTDPTKPAFLQPADPGGLGWTAVPTPDALDMLITSRNHDIKRKIARNAAPQDWIFALVSLQTMEGYGGAGNNGIARMNGGWSSRAMLGLAPTRPGTAQIDSSRWWQRDVERLSRDRNGTVGKTLLWQEPWPEGVSLSLDALDPLFIEISRRVRLSGPPDAIQARRSTSKAARVAGKDAKGNLGDPWAPVHKTDGNSLTLRDQDWSDQLLVRLLFSHQPEWEPPPLAQRLAAEAAEPMVLVAEAFARGNSKTDGFKSRVIPVPVALIRKLFTAAPAEVAPQVLKDVVTIEEALRNGLALVAAGGPREGVGKPENARSQPAREAFRHAAGALFFPELWARMAVTSMTELAPLRRNFMAALSRLAWAEFAIALPAIPCASLMRPRAEARGHLALETGLRRAMRHLDESEVTHGQT